MKHKVVIISGISRGLGAALRRVSEGRKLQVVGVGRSKPGDFSGEFFNCHLEDRNAVSKVAEELFSTISNRDDVSSVYLVNNAATTEPVGKVGALQPADIVSSLDTNLVAPLLFTHAFCKHLSTSPVEKRIINISSGAARQPIPGLSIYSVAKAGLDAATRAIADEYLRERICILSIHPGVIDTDMQRLLRTKSSKEFPSVALFSDFYNDGFLTDPDEVAAIIVGKYLLGDVFAGRVYSREFTPTFIDSVLKSLKRIIPKSLVNG